MATTYGYEPAGDAPPIFHMDDHRSTDTQDDMRDTPFAPSPALRAAPPPNPSFSFPALPDASGPTPAPSRRTGRRPMSAIEVPSPSYQLADGKPDQSNGRAALPVFSFNPGASLPPDPHAPVLASPVLSSPLSPQSPQSPKMIPSGARPAGHGHRRGGSEFVGGRLREGNSIAVMSSSPTKPDAGFPSPSLGPPRRGHRRGVSSALSTNDLSLLPPPQHNWTMKGSSAPNSPTNFDHLHNLPILGQTPVKDLEPEVRAKLSVTEHINVEPTIDEAKETVHQKPAPKARVGFSDTLEFIPRPLSLVSTDTSSTITAKPGHTVSGSITSIVSATSFGGNDSPAAISRSPTRDIEDPRPSTAGAILERTPSAIAGFNASPRRRNSIPALLDATAETTDIPASTPSPSKTSKRWSFFGLEPFASHGSPTKARPQSSNSGDTISRAVSASSLSDHGSDSAAESASKDTDQDGGKRANKNKRRRIVKGWADSILPRKQRNDEDKKEKYNVRPPTPPASNVPDEDEDEDDQVHVATSPAQPPPTLTVTESPTPPRPTSSRGRSDEVSSPMIDLDAALGPFNTPLPHNPEWEAAQRAAGNAGKRRLHSAQGMKGFSGPGMHYHRRAESAPDLPPFEAGRSSIHRFGSNSTMADVFEEDEEEEKGHGANPREGADGQTDDSEGEMTPSAMTPKQLPATEVASKAPSLRRKSSGLSEKDHASVASIRLHSSRTSLHESVIAEEPQGVRFRVNNVFQNELSGSPSLSPKCVSGPNQYPPLEFNAPFTTGSSNMPLSPNSMSYASSHPSPRSPMSADTQRLSTAPSSVHEENSFQSLLMGEPGPEVRLSVDYDIPSLTSSNSTMTRDSSFVPHARMSQPTLRQPRPLSVSSAAFGKRRSSLASLSRLISSSHGERSKLSMEVTLDNEADKRKAKDGKTKRLGKLMQFWKHRGSAPA